MNDIINKWNKTKDDLVKKEEELKAKTELLSANGTRPKWKDLNESIHIYYRDKNLVHKKSLIKLAKYFRIGERNTYNKTKHSFSNVARDIIEEYLSRDDIKELLEQIDKENK